MQSLYIPFSQFCAVLKSTQELYTKNSFVLCTIKRVFFFNYGYLKFNRIHPPDTQVITIKVYLDQFFVQQSKI